jgi:S-adenosylmethionine:tRNA ribosyltransferase-isomerase
MLVAYRHDRRLVPSSVSDLDKFLGPEDLLVINTSATLPAALDGTDLASGQKVVVHLSTRLSETKVGEETWVVEPRRPGRRGSKPWATEPFDGPAPAGAVLATSTRPTTGTNDGGGAGVPQLVSVGRQGDGQLHLLSPYRGSRRLWTARLRVPGPVLDWLHANGRPIRYGYVDRPWPLEAYQNVYATEPGSAEMPSAGRPLTAELVIRLVAKGVGLAPVVLHTGVASLEAGEPPYPERAHVPITTARRVNATKQDGGRVVAVGTTVVRALESAFDVRSGRVEPLAGWTDLVITPENGVHVVEGILTGWHEPEASHLSMIEAIAGRELVEASYRAALRHEYRWHEFGDVALFLP